MSPRESQPPVPAWRRGWLERRPSPGPAVNATPRADRAGTANRPRHLLALLGLLAGAGLALLSALDAGAARRLDTSPLVRLDQPQRADLVGYAAVRDAARVTISAAQLPPAWGGRYTTSTGEQVTIYSSRGYPEDPATNQRWADFLASLVHGPELGTVTVFLAPLREVQAVCGRRAAACYSPSSAFIMTPGDDLPDVTAEAVLTHEYGHHVAASRLNPPWRAVDWGTKRWASHVNVCARAAAGELFPGDEGANYALNPGEGFAESYRVLNERRAGLPETPWDVVDGVLYPDPTALSLLEQDVVAPWQSNSTSTNTETLGRAVQTRTVRVATPYDGSLALTFRAPPRSRFAVALYRGATRIGRAVTTAASRTRRLSTTVCGTRAFRVRVTRLAGAGRFTLTVSKP